MKTAIICYNCKKLKKESESYALKINGFIETNLNEMGQVTSKKDAALKVKICRPCAKRMGYKVKTIKKEVKKYVTV